MVKNETNDGKYYKNVNFIGKRKNKPSMSQDDNTIMIVSDQADMILENNSGDNLFKIKTKVGQYNKSKTGEEKKIYKKHINKTAIMINNRFKEDEEHNQDDQSDTMPNRASVDSIISKDVIIQDIDRELDQS